ncbi:hypothetical protein [Nocardioides sp. GXZ039]|uniref:hypothetical protein n=1 Tax=Nocardioides sp. GXZ039 TaxID=3136018 RepID=UPI0030F3E7B2
MSQSPPPPPPPGGYGTPPPPPSDGYGGYGGQQPFGNAGWSVGNAINYGWTKFQQNIVQILIAGVIVVVAVAVFQGLGWVIRGALVEERQCTGTSLSNLRCDEGSGFFITLLVSAISSFLFFAVYQIIGAGIIRGALAITEGRPFEYTELFKTERIGSVIVTSILSSIIVFIGFLLCFLPGIIAALMLTYANFYVIDKGYSPTEAIAASFRFVAGDGKALVWVLVTLGLYIVGALLCGIGLIVALPVAIIGTAYTYKLLNGQQVAA